MHYVLSPIDIGLLTDSSPWSWDGPVFTMGVGLSGTDGREMLGWETLQITINDTWLFHLSECPFLNSKLCP